MMRSPENPTNRYLVPKYLFLALFVAALFFALIHLVHVNADFPPGITTSGVLYTDEGWYASSAIRQYLTGGWYLEGDINTGVTQPGGQILYRISFALLGLSLSSARITIVFLFLLLILFTALLIRRYFGDLAATLSALLLSTNFFAFAYSRLALRYLIATFFIIFSLLIANELNGKRRQIKLVISTLLLAYAILTCTIAIFSVPLLFFLVWKKGKNRKESLVLVVTCCMILLVFVGGYLFIIRDLYPVDVANDNAAVTSGFITGFSTWFINLLHKIYWSIINLGIDFTILTILMTTSSIFISKRFRTDPLVKLLFGYIVIYILMLSINAYEPPRYYIMLLVPFTGLSAIAATTVMQWLSEKWPRTISYAPLVLILLISIHGSWQILSYLAHPKYSFYQMAHSVGNIIQEREGTVRGVLLFGDIADSISLEIGTNARNSLMWTSSSLGARLQEYHPNYIIKITSNIDQIAISKGAVLTQLGTWNVFDNYYATGEPVRLYYATWPEAPVDARLPHPIHKLMMYFDSLAKPTAHVKH